MKDAETKIWVDLSELNGVSIGYSLSCFEQKMTKHGHIRSGIQLMGPIFWKYLQLWALVSQRMFKVERRTGYQRQRAAQKDMRSDVSTGSKSTKQREQRLKIDSGVPKSLWNAHKSKDHTILPRNYTQLFFSSLKKIFFLRSKERVQTEIFSDFPIEFLNKSIFEKNRFN